MSITNQYRKRADECRDQAEKATRPIDKTAWLVLAEDWLKLAENSVGSQQALGAPKEPMARLVHGEGRDDRNHRLSASSTE